MPSMRAARSSYLKPRPIENVPKRSHSTDASKRWPPSASERAPAATRAEASTESADAAPPLRPRKSAISTADASGARRTRSAVCAGVMSGSVLQGVQAVHLDRLARAEERDDDREADGDLCGRDRQDEEDEDVAVLRPVEAGEGHERQGRGHEHELQAHVDDERVAAHQDPQEADREKRGAQHHVGLERGRHLASPGSRVRLLSTMTPSIAIRSRNPITCTGSR